MDIMHLLFLILLTAKVSTQIVIDRNQDEYPEEPPEEQQSRARGRRFIIAQENQLWHRGIIPYKFDKSLDQQYRNDYKQKVFSVYEKYSCLRFVPWSSKIKEKFDLNHDNYLTFEKTNGCESKIGNVNNNGQRISCCSWKTCLHEIAHALGFRHEQTSSLRDEFVRINYENILPGLANQFTKKDPSNYVTHKVYDFDSIMHYGYKAWSSNGEETITPLDQDMKRWSSFETTDTLYYLFEEINTVYQCTDDCDITCNNGGYKAMVDGVCECRCPDGLKTAGNCAKLSMKGCGDIITLNDETPTAQFQSPVIEGTSNPKTCHWFIKSPEHSRVILNFPEFDIRTNYGKCVDEVAVRYIFLGLLGIPYCGTVFKKTIQSYENILGISFTQTKGKVSSFTAEVSFVYDSDMCFEVSDKGHTYNGHVSHAGDSSPCLYWDEVHQCRHHLFNVQDREANLEANYCRNPDEASSPWCYTNADTCERKYCDACQIGVCKDIFTNCLSEIKKNNKFCDTDPEAVHGCRSSCGLCNNYTPLPSVSDIVCNTPVLPDDAQREPLQQQYTVGDQVTSRCNNGEDTQVITCLSDGRWTPLSFVCGTCKSGWYSFSGQCYKLFHYSKSKSIAHSMCKSQGATLVIVPSLDVHNFIRGLAKSQSGCEAVWLGMSQKGGTWTWDVDSTDLKWDTWAEGSPGGLGCAALTSGCEWKDRKCNLFFKFICQYPQPSSVLCADQRTDCHQILSRNPNFCRREASFASTYCPLTCGICRAAESQKIVCDDEGNAQNVLLSSTSAPLSRYIAYACVPGYQHVNGDLKRACALNGKLTGSPPICESNQQFAFPVNNVDIRARSNVGDPGFVYVADNEFHVVTMKGKIVKWTIYTKFDGKIGLQVWRRTQSSKASGGRKSRYLRFKLIGQNNLSGTRDGGQLSFEVAAGDRISVNEGDMIGVYYPDGHGGLPYDTCKKNFVNGGEQFISAGVRNAFNDFVTQNVYDFKKLPDGDCKVFSLNAFVSSS